MAAEIKTTTIDGVKYNTADINKDPVLKARYEYLSYDPKGNLLRTAEKNLAKAIENGWTQDIKEGKALVAKYKGEEASFSSASQKVVNPDDVTVSPYSRESVSQFPQSGETVGDLFTNPSNGATYNWRTGALVNDPNGNAIASGQGGTNNPLPPAQAPSSPSGITTGIGSTNLPTNTPTTGNPSGAIAGTSGIGTFLDTLQQENEANEKARVAEVAAQDKANQSIVDKLLGSTKSPTVARTAAQKETGITPANYFAEEKSKIEEIGKLTEEYNAVKAAKDAQIATTQDKLGSMNFINNQTAQIERNAAPKLNQLSANINSKAAVLQALQGRFAEAQDYVNAAVQDATADNKYKMDLFSTFYQVNQDSIERLDSIYQDAFKTSMTLATTAYEQQVKEKTEIGSMMIDPNLRGSGITINDTLDQAYAKATKVAGSNYVTDQARIHSGDDGAESGTGNFTSVMQEAINGGATADQAALVAAALSEKYGIPVSQKTLTDLTNQARNLKPQTQTAPASPPSQPITAYSTGQSAGTALNRLSIQNIGATAKQAIDTTTSFFKGLFGY